MKKGLLLSLLTAILSFNCYSQINFEKGYYINNEDQKTDCLIRNIDWKNNPTEFEFKLSENGESKSATIKSVKEFGIYNDSKYIRKSVNIDRSGERIGHLSKDRNPLFKEEELFLKVLLEGKANLYLFKDGNLTRYFYSKDDSKIKQLISKKYLTPDNKIRTNDLYKQQLWNDLKCANLTIRKAEKVDYKKNELVSFFEDYNECHGQGYTNFEEKEKRDLLNLNIRPGLTYSSLTIRHDTPNSKDTDFDNEIGFRIGMEAEFILPFNKNKWTVLIEPTYQYYKSEQSREISGVSGGTLVSKVDYQSIELPIGVRHNFYFSDKSQLFMNISYVFDFDQNSTIDFLRQDASMFSSLEIKSLANIAVGIGYKFEDKYSIEMRYNTTRRVLADYLYWNSDYKSISMILGYSLF